MGKFNVGNPSQIPLIKPKSYKGSFPRGYFRDHVSHYFEFLCTARQRETAYCPGQNIKMAQKLIGCYKTEDILGGLLV